LLLICGSFTYTAAHSADVDDVSNLLGSFTWTVAPITDVVPAPIEQIPAYIEDNMSHSISVIAQLTGYMALDRNQLCSQYATLCGKISFQ